MAVLAIVSILLGLVAGWLMARLFDPGMRDAARLLADGARVDQELHDATHAHEAMQQKFFEERRARTAAVEKFLHLSRILSERENFKRQEHRVFLDGPSGSGKSTFMRLITNPWLTPDQLRQIPATAAPVSSGQQPVGYSKDYAVLHTLSFFDGVGEEPDLLAEAVREYCARPDNADVRTTALLIWDLTRPWERNFDYFGRGRRMRLVYGAGQVRARFSGFVVLLNKVDEHALTRVERSMLEQRIRTEIFGELGDETAVFFAAASAVTGEGVHHAVGLTLEALQLTELATTEG